MTELFSLQSLVAGGPIVGIQLLMSVFALGLILERLWALRPGRIIPISHLRQIELALKENKLTQALDWARSNRSPMMKVSEVALINADKPKEDLKLIIEEAGRLEVPRLEKYLATLHTIATVSPLLGLLGTVTGMIRVFDSIVQQGAGNTQALAGGIAEALLTTAYGLVVAIPVLVFYNAFTKKVDLLLVDMERHSLILYELLVGNREPDAI